MKVISSLLDKRINSTNVLVELSIEEYLSFARDILDKNPFQRRRVRSSKTVYSLLRIDLEQGCIIPPIVLALTTNIEENEDFAGFISENKDHLVILDGLQRTYTLIDLINNLEGEKLQEVLANILRVEFYVGLNRLGILYRMLTLNTGQSPMSLRQQIEILYLDYASTSIEGIELLREVDERRAFNINQYNFREVVEGFNSYLDRDELPIDRVDLLENIRGLETLSKESQDVDLFGEYLKSWHAFVVKMYELCGDNEVSEEFQLEAGSPFGSNVLQVFKKAQAVSGFGAAIGKLKDYELIHSFSDINNLIEGIHIDNAVEFLETINRSLLWIKGNTSKIGNAQRAFFHYFFRGIFNREDDGYQNPLIASETALRKYQSQNL
jgi:hypothetical protein